MKRLVLKQMNRDFEIIENRLINFYLDDFERRTMNGKNAKITYLFYLVIVCYVSIIAKCCVCLFCPLDYQTRLLLYDFPYLMGGIPEYNELIVTLPLSLGTVMVYKFHISRDSNFIDFLLLMDLIRGKKKMLRLFLDRDNTIILKKVTHAASRALKIAKYMNVAFCKYLCILIRLEQTSGTGGYFWYTPSSAKIFENTPSKI